MEILHVRALSGPNIWARAPVLEALVDLGMWRNLSREKLVRFDRCIQTLMPGLSGRIAGPDEARAADDQASFTTIARAIRDVTLELQSRVRTPLSIGRVILEDDSGVCRIAVQYEEEKLGRACLIAARLLCLSVLNGDPIDVEAEIQRLRALAAEVCLGRATGPIVAAALARGIPCRRLDEASLVQLGHGVGQRRIQAAVTDRTSKIAEFISIDKEFSKRLLSEIGIPVPAGRPVADVEDAWIAACELGTPVVVKPRDADYGRGVSVAVTSRAQVAAAYEEARRFRDDVLVEKYIPGIKYRVTVVGNRVVAAVSRDLISLTADGLHSIRELIDLANQDPRRGEDERLPLNYISPDVDTESFLAEQGYDLQSIPSVGQSVVLSRFSDPSLGAGVTDVTDLVHPRIADQCVGAAQLLGVDIAGVDLIAKDISLTLEEQGGVMLELNAEPTIALHFPPYCDRYRPVCEAIVEWLFPGGQTGYIPTAVIAGTGDTSRISRWLCRFLGGNRGRIGRATSEGLYLDDWHMKVGDEANVAGAQALFLCPEVGTAILERSFRRIRDEGLGLDRCEVAVFHSPGHGGFSRDPDSEAAARVLAESVMPLGFMIIAAEDPAAFELASRCPGGTILVERRGNLSPPARMQTLSAGTVHLRGGDVVLSLPGGTEHILQASDRLLAEGEEVDFSDHLLWAAAAAWAMHVPVEELRSRLDFLQ